MIQYNAARTSRVRIFPLSTVVQTIWLQFQAKVLGLIPGLIQYQQQQQLQQQQQFINQDHLRLTTYRFQGS